MSFKLNQKVKTLTHQTAYDDDGGTNIIIEEGTILTVIWEHPYDPACLIEVECKTEEGYYAYIYHDQLEAVDD